MAHLAMLFRFLVEYIKFIIYSMLQLTVFTTAFSDFRFGGGSRSHDSEKCAWLLRMLRYNTYSDPKLSSATIVELFKFSIDPVLNSTETLNDGCTYVVVMLRLHC